MLVVQVLNDNYYGSHRFLQQWLVLGIVNVFLGMIFFILQPYKQKWMSHFDGWILTLVGILLLLEIIKSKSVYIPGAVAGVSTTALLSTFAAYYKLRNA